MGAQGISHALGTGILAANVELLERVQARVVGHDWEDLARPQWTPSPAIQESTGATFSEFAKNYLEFSVTEHGWKMQTKACTRADTGTFFGTLRKLSAMNEQANCRVPVHPISLSLGFWNYVAGLQSILNR